MSFRFRCPGCGTTQAVDRGLAGKQVCCSKCRRVLVLRAAAPAEIHFEVVTDDRAQPIAATADREPGLPAEESPPAPTRRRPRRVESGWKGTLGIALLVCFTVGSVALVARFDRAGYRPPTLVGKWKSSDVMADFQGNGSVAFMGLTKRLLGVAPHTSVQWSIIGSDDDTLRMRLGPDSQPILEARVVFEDPNTFTLIRERGYGDQPPLIFTRAKD